MDEKELEEIIEQIRNGEIKLHSEDDEEEKNIHPGQVIEENERYDYSCTFSEYLKNARDKFSCAVTKNQYAIEIGGFTHEDMVTDLIQKTRPDIKIDGWGNAINPDESYRNGNAIVVGYPYYILVELPSRELLSKEQFECLKSIFLEVKKYNENNHERGYGRDYELQVYGQGLINIEYKNYEDNINELINMLSNYVSDDVLIPQEVIIGTPLQEYLNNSFGQQRR